VSAPAYIARLAGLWSVADYSSPVLFPNFVGDAGPGQSHELGEWRVRPA
jgi:hypothetical protein